MRVGAAVPLILALTIAISGRAADTVYGYVPDAATAIAIGRAVLIPIYGEKQIRSEEPLVAKQQGDIWTVSGTLHCDVLSWWEKLLGEKCFGGTAEVKLSAKTGGILHVTHYE